MARRLAIIVSLVATLAASAGCGGTWALYINGQKVYPRDETPFNEQHRVLGPYELFYQPEFWHAVRPP